jgi:catechol 2,3-dioxygenase-like lactoylglutathione lyase family enzyme
MMFKETHPILGTRDILRAVEFYTRQLGFEIVFEDKTDPPNYVGFRRDAVEIPMQFQFDCEMSAIRLRFLVEDPDALSATTGSVASSALPTRCTILRGERASSPYEFALFDLDRNALTFYRSLTGAEKSAAISVG